MNNVIVMLMNTSICRDNGSDPQLSERVYIQLKSMNPFWLHIKCSYNVSLTIRKLLNCPYWSILTPVWETLHPFCLCSALITLILSQPFFFMSKMQNISFKKICYHIYCVAKTFFYIWILGLFIPLLLYTLWCTY